MQEASLYSGTPERGEGRAGTLGFPTVNIRLDDPTRSGIYAAEVLIGSQIYHAAAYADPQRNILEAHLLNTSSVPAGALTIRLCEKIRDDKRFENDAELQAAITGDITRIKEYFKNA